jgi:tRNA threonylcarbamoyladenosine biosynthesis protein TsaE
VEILCQTIEQLSWVAAKIIEFAERETIWVFEGQMGAGKTTLIKAVCEQLKVIDNVSSPTFGIVNEYLTATQKSLYHFDFYRLKSEQEALDIGIEEYFDSGNWCFLEWASKIPTLLPPAHFYIEINVLPDNQRVIKLIRHE